MDYRCIATCMISEEWDDKLIQAKQLSDRLLDQVHCLHLPF